MEKYHVWINRVLCCVCSLVYFVSGLASADTQVCSGGGVGAGVSSMPSCKGYFSANNGTNITPTPLQIISPTLSSYMCVFGAPTKSGYKAGDTIQGGNCEKQVNHCEAGSEPPDKEDGAGGSVWATSGRMGGKSACMANGCTASGTPDGHMGIGVGGGNVEYFTFFKNMKQTGATCNFDDQQKNGNSPDTNCGPGEGSATVNGKTRCFQEGDPKPNQQPKPKTETTTKETENPDGTKTKTETTTTSQQNGDGTSTTTTTTTTTKTGADGTPIGTEKTVEVKKTDKGNKENEDNSPDKNEDKTKDFCEKNPQLNICKNSTVEGTCESTTCNGDAITCEALKLQRANDCELKKDTAEKTLGKQINDKNDPLKGSLPTVDNAKQVDLSALNLNANGWGLGGACMQDKNISVMGKVVVIPFSSLCEYLLALRYAIMLIAGILSFKIVSGAVLTV